MRRFQTLLLVAGLAAAPTRAALAGPDNSHNQDRSVEVFEWSMGKGRLGIVLMGLTPELRQYFGATGASGVLVARVEADSPAAKAGVRVGDVLTKTNDRSVADVGDVRAAIATAKKGDKVELGIMRDHKPLTLEVVLVDNAPPRMPRIPDIESFWSHHGFRNLLKSFEEPKG